MKEEANRLDGEGKGEYGDGSWLEEWRLRGEKLGSGFWGSKLESV